MLESVATEGAAEAADRLRRRVKLWLSQRLWSINLAPELVLHDDRHVSAVDRHVSVLAEPLLRQGSLRVHDAEALACAAWLHDWGHVGGPIGIDENGREIVVTSPQTVRKYHGLISQRLIRPEWDGMHGIDDEALCARAAVICGHHQGWTSFGNEHPKKQVVRSGTFTSTEFIPPSLADNIAAVEIPSDLSLERVQLLIALLRVADGADLGVHRIPDAGAPKAAFLAHCIRMQAWRAKDELIGEEPHDKRRLSRERALDEVIVLASHYAAARSDMTSGRQVSSRMRELLSKFDDSPALQQLLRYIEFTDNQAAYYENHSRVGRVNLEVSRVRGATPTVVVTVLTTPNLSSATSKDERCHVARAAVDSVARDIKRELDSGGTGGDRSVRDVLANWGVMFDRCVAVEAPDISARLTPR
jgi:hypothetical protein